MTASPLSCRKECHDWSSQTVIQQFGGVFPSFPAFRRERHLSSAIKKHGIPSHAKVQESITRRQNRKLPVSRPKSMISSSQYMLCPGKVGKTSPCYVILGIDGDCTTRAPSQAHGLAQMQEQSTMQGRHGCDALSIARRIALIYAIMQGRYGYDAPALAWRAADDARTSRT